MKNHSSVVSRRARRRAAKRQKWSIGASIPVPLACEASDLPIDLMPRVWGHAASSPSRVITHHSTAGTRPSLTALFEWEAVTLGDVAACVTTSPSAQTQFRNQTSSSIARTCTSTVCPILFRLPLQYSKFVAFKTASKAKLLKFFTNKFTPPHTVDSCFPRTALALLHRRATAAGSTINALQR